MKHQAIEQFELFTPVTNVVADAINLDRSFVVKQTESFEWTAAKVDKAADKAKRKAERVERRAARKAARQAEAAAIAESIKAKWAAWRPDGAYTEIQRRINTMAGIVSIPG